MLFADRIKELREKKQMVQRQFAAVLEIDTPMYCKIERRERRAKRGQVIALAQIFKVNPNDFLSLWLSDQVTVVVEDEHKAGGKVLDIAKQNIKNRNIE
jgi:transcriptional regulator with XRE-family HTH domain